MTGTVGGPGPDPEHEVDRLLRGLWDQVAHDVAREKRSARAYTRRRALALRRRPAERQRYRPGPRRSRMATVRAWAIGIAFAAVCGVLSWLQIGGLSGGGDRPVPVVTAPAPSRSPAGPPADPFAGSPAEHFADGQAGITLPAARPAGPFSAAQVSAAYREVRKLLIAGNLDPRILNGGSPDAFAQLLVPRQRAHFLRGLGRRGLTKAGTMRSTRALVVSFAPGTARLIGKTVKVHGTMSASTAMDNGRRVLRIHVDYLFVYPVEQPGRPAGWMRIVDRNYGTADFAAWDHPGGPLQPWLRRWNGGGPAGGRCDITDGFVHPAYPPLPPGKVQPSGRPVSPYDQARPPAASGCQAITGT